ncbi:MAG: hypothetical protein WB852_09360, partial [Thermoplasmata archaeon]
AVYRAYRSAVDRGLTADVLTSAALGVIGALRAPAPPTRAASATSAPGGGVSPWAHEGRARLHAQRRWVDASTRRSGR